MGWSSCSTPKATGRYELSLGSVHLLDDPVRYMEFHQDLLGGTYRCGLVPRELRISLEASLTAKHTLGAPQHSNICQHFTSVQLGSARGFCYERMDPKGTRAIRAWQEWVCLGP